MGQYKLQIKDSPGKDWFLGVGDMGGIIDTANPMEHTAQKSRKVATSGYQIQSIAF